MNGLSPTDYAKKMGVDRSTVHRWINNNRLEFYYTPSGRKMITGVKPKNIEIFKLLVYNNLGV